MTHELESFRELWLQEIALKGGSESGENIKESHMMAVKMFAEAAQAEERGDLNEAIKLYRQAFRLDPNLCEIEVERMSNHLNRQKLASGLSQPQPAPLPPPTPRTAGSGDRAVIHRPNLPLVVREDETKSPTVLFIGDLAPEIILHIFSFLEAVALDTASGVCASWHVLAREASLWRKLCEEVWGADCIEYLPDFGNSWRELFLHKPHLHFDGLYVNKSSSIRPGLREWGDLYDPIRVIKYFRYIRFYPDGTAITMLSNTEPRTVLAHTKREIQNEERAKKGSYVFDDGKIEIVVRLDPRTTFRYRLFIAKTNARVRQCLRWSSMQCIMADGEEVTVPFDNEGPYYFLKC